MPANDFSDPVFSFDSNLSTSTPTASAWSALAGGGSSVRWWRRIDYQKLMPRADWLISFIVHAFLLIVLAFIGVGRELLPTAVTLIAEEAAESPTVATQFSAAANDLEVEAISFDSIVAQADESASLEATRPEAALDTTGLGAINSTVARQALAALPSDSLVAGRSGTAKLSLLSKYGGTAKTEAAVNLGLEWLIRQQSADGSWSFHGPFSNGASFGENNKAATGMALIAFLGAGHTHMHGEHREHVRKGVEWLVKEQNADGGFIAGTPGHHAIYTHAICTLALSEAYAMTNDTWLKRYVELGIKFTLRAQSKKGGWRYEFASSDSDTSVTGWCMMALVSAKSAGIEVAEKNLRQIHSFLNSVDSEEHSQYGYQPNSRATASMTAEGMLCRMYLGWSRTNPAIEACAQWLEETAPFQKDELRYYYWYYATQVMHHAGADHWKKWNQAMREQLPALQITEGAEAGSWPLPSGGTDNSAGRLYVTCMALYCLEVYYRHLPLYDSFQQ